MSRRVHSKSEDIRELASAPGCIKQSEQSLNYPQPMRVEHAVDMSVLVNLLT